MSLILGFSVIHISLGPTYREIVYLEHTTYFTHTSLGPINSHYPSVCLSFYIEIMSHRYSFCLSLQTACVLFGQTKNVKTFRFLDCALIYVVVCWGRYFSLLLTSVYVIYSVGLCFFHWLWSIIAFVSLRKLLACWFGQTINVKTLFRFVVCPWIYVLVSWGRYFYTRLAFTYLLLQGSTPRSLPTPWDEYGIYLFFVL